MELLEVKPHPRDHSNKVVINDLIKQLLELSRSSNVRQLRSRHNVHIKHIGTRHLKSASQTSSSTKTKDPLTSPISPNES